MPAAGPARALPLPSPPQLRARTSSSRHLYQDQPDR